MRPSHWLPYGLVVWHVSSLRRELRATESRNRIEWFPWGLPGSQACSRKHGTSKNPKKKCLELLNRVILRSSANRKNERWGDPGTPPTQNRLWLAQCDDSSSGNSAPCSHFERNGSLWIFIAPVAILLLVYVPAEVEMSLITHYDFGQTSYKLLRKK